MMIRNKHVNFYGHTILDYHQATFNILHNAVIAVYYLPTRHSKMRRIQVYFLEDIHYTNDPALIGFLILNNQEEMAHKIKQ